MGFVWMTKPTFETKVFSNSKQPQGATILLKGLSNLCIVKFAKHTQQLTEILLHGGDAELKIFHVDRPMQRIQSCES